MENFWDYSVRVYGLPKVSQHCLHLQDHYGFDVNLLLFACWHAHTHGKLSPELLHQAVTFSQLWSQNLVQTLRQSRRWMKTDTQLHALLGTAPNTQANFQTLRNQVKGLELKAEKFQQEMLESLVTTNPIEQSDEQKLAISVANIRLLAEHQETAINEDLAQALKDFVASVTQ